MVNISVSFVTIQTDLKQRDTMKDADKYILVTTFAWLKQSSCSISLNGISFMQKTLRALSLTVTYNYLRLKISSAMIYSTNHR